MAEYIKKEKLFDCLDIKNALGGHYGISLTAINAIPAADVVEVRHGQWIFGQTMGHSWMKCSECCVSQDGQTATFTYCPSCGAKMDGGTDN